MSVVPGSTPGPQPSHTTSLGTMATTEVIHLNRLAAISTNSAGKSAVDAPYFAGGKLAHL
jgi:hypothetical protein